MVELPTPAYFACGAAGAAGFGILFNVPPRLLLVCVLGGGIAVATRGLVALDHQYTLFGYTVGWTGFGIETGATLGALVAGTWGVLWSHRLRTPSSVLSVPAVIPLVPGVFSYTALMNLVNINHVKPAERQAALVATFEYGLKAALIILGITLGVTLPRMINRWAMKRAALKAAGAAQSPAH